MILSPLELHVVRPALAFIDRLQHGNVVVRLLNPTGRELTVDISAAGILIKATYPDSSPIIEFYRLPMGFAQAYGLPIEVLFDEKD